MKKILALILALIMLFALAGCGSKKATTWEEQLGTQGKLRVAISPDYPPYEGYDAQGNVVGFDVEVAKYIANYLGVELEVVPLEFTTIISAITAGTVDAGISCFSYTEDRAQSVLFSDTYLKSSQAAFASTKFGVNSLEDCKGGVVGAGEATTGMDVAESLKDQYGFQTQGGEIAIMTESVRAGAMQAIITEYPVCMSYINEYPDDFQLIASDLSVEETKAVVNKGNDLLLEKFNEAIAAFMAEDNYNDLIVSYFG